MNRRKFLTLAGVGLGSVGLGAAGTWTLASGSPSPFEDEKTSETVAQEDVPETVQEARPLAEAFHEHISEYYPEASVHILAKHGDLAMEYETSATGEDELMTEFHQVASEYADVVKKGDHDPRNLSIVTSEVRAIVVQSALKAYVNDEVEKDAFLETVEVSDA